MKALSNVSLKNISDRSAIRKVMNNYGMTLLEIMIVVILIGGLMTIVGNQVVKQRNRAQYEQAKIQIKSVAQALDRYQMDCGFYPASLDALVQNDGNCQSWGPDSYLDKIPKDPWNNDFIYEASGKNTYELISLGSDRSEGGDGYGKDISSSEL